MSPFAVSKLPSIDAFTSGLLTNRNPASTPHVTTVTGQKIHAYDSLIDGQNVEISAINTLQRRPGLEPFLSTAPATAIWQYKDLNGAISLFVDTGSSLVQNGTTVINNSAGATSPWSLEPSGNFLYGTNGIDFIRINNDNLTHFVFWGQSTPQVKRVVSLNSLGYFNAVTGFVPSADAIAGVLQVEDGEHSRSLTITINPTSIHLNIEYTGNPVSTNQSYTQVTIQTQTGTAPNTTTTDLVTVTSGLTATLSEPGVTNGIINYYPQTGTSTLDLDYAFTGTLTLSALSTIINTLNSFTFTGGSTIPVTATQWLQVFISTSIVNGIWHNPGQSPIAAQTGVGMNITVPASLIPTNIQVSSGLFDVTNAQLSLDTNIGVAPRLYQYISPVANITDTFTGSLQMYLSQEGDATLFTFTNKTLFEIGNAINGIIIAGSYQTAYIASGTTCYLVIRSVPAASTGSTPGTADNVLVMNVNTMVDNADLNLNFQNWTFLESNDYPQQPQQGVQITYAARDIISGGLSNVAAPVTVGPQLYPCRWNISLSLPSVIYDHTVTNLECYRTVDGGSSFLFEQLVAYQNGQSYQTESFSITDAGLNDQLIGPINEENDPPPVGLKQITTHTNRKWGVVGNKVYYSGGPETINGNGDESWPPNNYFAFPGLVTAVMSLGTGLAVALTDDIHLVSGVDPSSYYSKPWLIGFGISNPNAWVRDGAALYIYTTKSQLHEITQDSGKEIGFDIGNLLKQFCQPQSTSITFHRDSAEDTALYVSNGTNSIFRYNPAQRVWSTRYVPVGINAGRVKSLETSTGVNTLLNATSTGIFARSLTTFTDNGAAYPAFATIGVMQLAPPGQRVTVNNIAMQLQPQGTMPQVAVLFNEVSGSFTRLFNPVNDPPDAPASISIWQKRWYTQQTVTALPTGNGLVNLASIKITFAPEAVQNEVLGIFLRDAV